MSTLSPPSPALTERIRATLSDTDPELKMHDRYPFLRGRVRIMLDGEDVTSLCRGFSIPAGKVLLKAMENGRHLFDWKCGCGRVRGTMGAFYAATGGRGGPARRVCKVCIQEFQGPTLAEEIRIGRVEVVPIAAFPPSTEVPEEEEAPV